jgi:divalent metal cation (Fe/Co/Zn/Cd) transporter
MARLKMPPMGPEEVVVMAKVRPSAKMNIEKLTQAMDDLDRKIRQELPVVADVFIDITTNRAQEHSRTRSVNAKFLSSSHRSTDRGKLCAESLWIKFSFILTG